MQMTYRKAIIILDRLVTTERIEVDREELCEAVKVAQKALNIVADLPPNHGRLIDADNVSSDAMCSHCVEEYCRNNCECFIENVQTILSNELITPTIIEAEVSE